MSDEPVAALDMSAVLADIEAEVRARRASGDLPEGLERELDAAFARFAPVDAVSGDFDTLLAKLEESTTFDTRAPTASRTRGVSQVKSVIGRAIDWDLRHLANQVSGATHAISRALALLGRRVSDLERDSPSRGDERLWDLGLGRLRPEMPPGDWAPLLVEAFSGAAGRVLHTEAGPGLTLRALAAAGVDAYGVDPLDRPPAEGGAEVRTDGTRAHLTALPVASLGGLVLSGVVDRWSPGALVELVDLARQRLSAGSRLAVVSHAPGSWADANPVIADLADGRPWRPETWAAVLERRGFSQVRTEARDGGYAVIANR